MGVDWLALDITWVGEVANDVLDVSVQWKLSGADFAGPDILKVSVGATNFPGIGPDNLSVGGGFTISDGGVAEIEAVDPSTLDTFLSGDPVSAGDLPVWLSCEGVE